MERSEHGGRRSRASGEDDSAGADGGRGGGGRAVYVDQCSGAVCASGGGSGRIATRGERCDADCGRSVGSRTGGGWDGTLDAGDIERNGDERGEGAVCG